MAISEGGSLLPASPTEGLGEDEDEDKDEGERAPKRRRGVRDDDDAPAAAAAAIVAAPAAAATTGPTVAANARPARCADGNMEMAQVEGGAAPVPPARVRVYLPKSDKMIDVPRAGTVHDAIKVGWPAQCPPAS